MTKHERVLAAFRRRPLDRSPIALWRHFPGDDQTAAGLAKAVARFHRQYDFDFVKVTPASDYIAVDWGLRGDYRGNLEGVREVVSRPIETIGDWEKLRPLDVSQGSLGQQLDSLCLLAKELGEDAPIVETIFSPLSTLRKIGGQRWLSDLRAEPEIVTMALEVVAESTGAFAREARRAGADGIFFASQAASKIVMDEAEYQSFGEPYDRLVLEAAGGGTFDVLHLHGEQVLFNLADQYPVAAVNWHDRRTPPVLRDATRATRKGLIGGLNELATLLTGSPDDVRAEVTDAIAQTAGIGLMVGAGCVIRIDTPEANILAAVAAARANV